MLNAEENQDAEFLSRVILEICKYAKENGMEPDETLRVIAGDIIQLLEVASFNNVKMED